MLDVLGGIAVHARGGDRATYKPLASPWSDRPDPVEIACAIRAKLGLSTIYVADLDAIQGRRPNCDCLRSLAAAGLKIWLDPGIKSSLDLSAPHLDCAEKVVLGSETVGERNTITSAITAWGPMRVMLSMDLRSGKPLVSCPEWRCLGEDAIVAQASAMGIRQVILLDLACVGQANGSGQVARCRKLLPALGNSRLYVGGGINSERELATLAELGVQGALVGTALHEGRITGRLG